MSASKKDVCGKFLAFLSFVTFLLYIAGLASPAWIQKEYKVPPAAIASALQVPQVKVESMIGLVWACTEKTILAPSAEGSDEKCESLSDIDPGLIDTWRWIAAGLGIGALVVAFFCLICACVMARRRKRDTAVRIGVVFFYLIACGLLVATLVMFGLNKEIEIDARLQLKIDYNLEWGFYVTVASAGLFFILSMLNVITLASCLPLNSYST